MPVNQRNVLKAVDYYHDEYKAPASVSDIQFLLSIPHGSKTDKAIDRALVKAPSQDVKKTADRLESQGLIRKAEGGGYILTKKDEALTE